MIRIATRADLPRIVELFSRSNDAPYNLAVVAEEKCFGAGISGETNVSVFGDFAGVAVTCGKSLRILAVDRRHRWRGIGSALLRDAVSRGARIVAAEAGNYFTPGVVITDTPTIDFFTKRGFRETANTYNLVVELGVGSREWGVGENRDRGEENRASSFLPLPTPHSPLPIRVTTETRDRVLAFVENQFGRIWRFEASNAGDNLLYVE